MILEVRYLALSEETSWIAYFTSHKLNMEHICFDKSQSILEALKSRWVCSTLDLVVYMSEPIAISYVCQVLTDQLEFCLLPFFFLKFIAEAIERKY